MQDSLLAKYFSGEASALEAKEVEQWLHTHPQEASKLEALWELNQRQTFAPDVALAWRKIHTHINKSISIARWRKRVFRGLAAAIVFLTIGGLGWWLSGKNTEEWTTAQATNQIQKIKLADGSQIWLNKHSELRYPPVFQRTQRKVYLKGEAFFEISKDAKKPFIIQTKHTTTRVLGTSFNIKSTSNDELVEVTVASGTVAFADKYMPTRSLILNKNQQGTYHKAQRKLIRNNLPNQNALAWKTGILTFKRTSLSEVCKALSRFYDKPIVLENKQLGSCILTTTLDHHSWEEAVDVIATTLNIEYQLDGQRIVFRGNSCNQ